MKLTTKALSSAGDKNECNCTSPPPPPTPSTYGFAASFTFVVITDVTLATVYLDVTSLMRCTRKRADVSQESVGYVYTYCVNNTNLLCVCVCVCVSIYIYIRDGLHTGPKHVAVYYISLLSLIQ